MYSFSRLLRGQEIYGHSIIYTCILTLSLGWAVPLDNVILNCHKSIYPLIAKYLSVGSW